MNRIHSKDELTTPGGSEAMTELLHKTFALLILLNEGEEIPTDREKERCQ